MKMERARPILIFILIVAGFSSINAQHKFIIDLYDIADDHFKVNLEPDGLSEQNNIFQFASIAPGTYQTMDIGRFVRDFKAFNANGDALVTEQVSTNQWKLSEPSKIKRIEYSIAETWDTPVQENVIYNMAGTSLETDHSFINNHCVLGYFHGMQSHEIWIKLNHPEEWQVGTALSKNTEGYYTAPTFDFVVDSPILLGRLSKASTDVEGTQVDVFTYSKTDLIQSPDILNHLEDILFAASKFTKGLPVDRYVFLYHFEDMDYGAWEHSYSSIYALQEKEINEERIGMFRSIAAHEFYHVVTPLHIHSELVEHLWLYEGVTEWAAISMQLRGEIMTLEEYLREMTIKLYTSDGFDPNISLTQLGKEATNLQDQYVNIYHKGAMTAGLLDLLILKRSKGKSGLREILNDLSKKYGPNEPFDETGFFNELEEITYPEVGDFIDRFIKGTQPLPIREYFNHIGISYTEFAGYDSSKVSLGFGLTVVGNNIAVANVDDEISEIKQGDILKSVDGTEISLMNAEEEFIKFQKRKVGDHLLFKFLRGNDEIEVDWELPALKIKHNFELLEKPKKKQLKLRKRWMSNF